MKRPALAIVGLGVVLLSFAVLAGVALASPALAEPIFSDGFEASGTCRWSDGPCGRMVFVSAGNFTMGSNSGHLDEQPMHTVYLDDYWIDRTEVTQDAYAACIGDGACSAPVPYDPTWTTGDPDCNRGAPWGSGDQPVNCVNWYQSDAYCTWAWKHLPTEAQWEKAARATDARTYPWGEAPPTCAYTVMYDQSGEGSGCGLDHTWTVGSKPADASPYGALDMAGNVFEWVNDWYSSIYYSSSPYANPLGPASGVYRVIRGGAWNHIASSFPRAWSRDNYYPSGWYNNYGFRCARDGG